MVNIILNKNKKYKKVVVKRRIAIKILLESELSFQNFYSQFEKEKNTILKVNFNGTKYSIGGKYCFPFTDAEAQLIMQSCRESNSFEQLIENAFSNDILNKFDFEIIDIESKTKQLLKWDYSELVVSAVYFHLEHLYKNYLNRQKKTFPSDKSFYELNILSNHLGLLFLNENYGKKLFAAIETTNLFRVYTYHWLFGFKELLRIYSRDIMKPNDKQDKEVFFNVVSRYFSVDFRNVSLYLQAFSHFIPLSLVNQVSKYTYLTKSVVVLHYIVKIYEIVFDSKKTQFLKHSDYVTFFSQLESELNSIIE